MHQIGREMRPMLNGSWKRPHANGRHGFTLRGFIIGLLIAGAILAPAAGLILDDGSAYATPPATLLEADSSAIAPIPPIQPPEMRTARTTLSAVAPPAVPAATATATGNQMRRRTYTVQMRVTAYCPCRKCCGKFSDGKTASGKTIWDNDGKFVAAPKWLPFGATVKIPGFHQAQPVPVYDRGRVITGYRLDVFFFDHQQALRWGTQYLDVEITLPN